MIVSEETFEVIDRYASLSGNEKRQLGLTREDCFWTVAEFLDVEDHCFYCGRILTLPCCMWNSSQGQIYMHPECATRLARGISRDADELIESRKAKPVHLPALHDGLENFNPVPATDAAELSARAERLSGKLSANVTRSRRICCMITSLNIFPRPTIAAID